MPTLKVGDRGESVKVLQRALNRVCSLLLVDGDFGPVTQAAVADAYEVLGRPGPPVADDAFVSALQARPEPSTELTAPGVVFIGREEVSSPAAYRATYRSPVWPTANSGITIGIGYDLAHTTPAQFRANWSALPAATLDRLMPAVGVRGSRALCEAVKDIQISLPLAVTVFLQRMVPTHAAATRSIYPRLDTLPPARRTALISLVFNRGTDLTDDPGSTRRREMKLIQTLLAAGDVELVANELESMTRIWDPQTERGVILRRRREATLWRAGFAALQLA